jgi:hypothetical protein
MLLRKDATNMPTDKAEPLRSPLRVDRAVAFRGSAFRGENERPAKHGCIKIERAAR